MTDSIAEEAANVNYELSGSVAIITIDDGKANALGHATLAGLEKALDSAETDLAKAVVVVGREGKFSAGFDLSVMTSGADQARELLARGARLGIRMFDFASPVILGVTGHALAMGAILLCCADVRIGADGPFKLGLNEVRIGMPVPAFAVEVCRDRLSPRGFTRAVQLGQTHTPQEAALAGFLDEVVAPEAVKDRALELASEYADAIHPGAFEMTRRTVRGDLSKRLQEGLAADMALFDVAQA